ncbi:MAG: MBL fold metallo-hydrolase [Dehalococcoidales bacterium]|nr:MAG: MBL fold metallo-hydrolase [Dehalococcoidales bacterium]
MTGNRGAGTSGSSRDSVVVVKETLAGGNAHLTSLVFRHGGNVYILTYQRNGLTRHTFIDAGDSRHSGEILSILSENNVNPADIERIIITHRHPDHFGLAYLLAGESGAKVMAHHSFRSLVEGQVGQIEQRWLSDSDLSRLKECDIEYLQESGKGETVKLAGVAFPSLADSVDIGEGGRFDILGCPESTMTHSPDQLVALYSPRNDPHPHEQSSGDFRPTDDIIFSGDLWLMRGPMFSSDMTDIMWRFRTGMRQMRSLMSGGSMVRRDPRVQDSEAKDALKKGFCLIRVKPGHGNEFLGTRIIPCSLLADNDMLVEFGYSLDAGISVLKSAELAPRVAARREQAYVSFIEELVLWTELGYTPDEISGLLVRIYREQIGGGPLVEKDRQERRERLKDLLTRLRADETQPESIRQIAESTQSILTSDRL